jgi:hypothetical protein
MNPDVASRSGIHFEGAPSTVGVSVEREPDPDEAGAGNSGGAHRFEERTAIPKVVTHAGLLVARST